MKEKNSIIPIAEFSVNVGYLLSTKFINLIKNTRSRQERNSLYYECSTIYAVNLKYFMKKQKICRR